MQFQRRSWVMVSTFQGRRLCSGTCCSVAAAVGQPHVAASWCWLAAPLPWPPPPRWRRRSMSNVSSSPGKPCSTAASSMPLAAPSRAAARWKICVVPPRAVQRLYAEAGYAGVVAYVPPQTGSDGTITIAVVEGRIARVTVPGASAERAAAARASLPDLIEGADTAGAPHRRPDRDRQREPGRAACSCCSSPAPSRARSMPNWPSRIVRRQPSSSRWTTPATRAPGEYRAGIGWRHADISGVGDILALQASTSPTEPVQAHGPQRQLPAALPGLAGGGRHLRGPLRRRWRQQPHRGRRHPLQRPRQPGGHPRPAATSCAAALTTSAWAWPSTGANT